VLEAEIRREPILCVNGFRCCRLRKVCIARELLGDSDLCISGVRSRIGTVLLVRRVESSGDEILWWQWSRKPAAGAGVWGQRPQPEPGFHQRISRLRFDFGSRAAHSALAGSASGLLSSSDPRKQRELHPLSPRYVCLHPLSPCMNSALYCCWVTDSQVRHLFEVIVSCRVSISACPRQLHLLDAGPCF
jgi:hypothetical protein